MPMLIDVKRRARSRQERFCLLRFLHAAAIVDQKLVPVAW